MRRFTSAMLALAFLPILFALARPAAAQYTSSSQYGTTGVPENFLIEPDGKMAWEDHDEKVQGIVLLRRGQESLLALKDVKAKINELNEPGRLLPGVQCQHCPNGYRELDSFISFISSSRRAR